MLIPLAILISSSFSYQLLLKVANRLHYQRVIANVFCILHRFKFFIRQRACRFGLTAISAPAVT